MSELFKKENIFLNKDLKSRDDVLKYVSEQAENLGIGKKEDIYQSFKDREGEASTGMQDGIAMPHAISEKIENASIIYLTLTNKLSDWETFDDTKVDKVIAMLVPKNGEQQHLEIISNFAASLIDDTKRTELDRLDNIDDIFEFLNVNTEVEE